MKKTYYAPTPIWARKAGDALLTASATVTTYAIGTHNDTLALVAMWIGVAGKFASNLFNKKTNT